MKNYISILKFRKYFLLLLTILVLAIQTNLFSQDKAELIKELVKKYSDYGLFMGTVLVADKDGILYEDGFGDANIEWDIPNKPNVKFRLGSITKQFTAMLIMQLVEKGKVDLDGKITDYLDYYRQDTGDKVTIHHLLTHTSGIPSYTSLPDFMEKVSRKYYEPDECIKEYCMKDLQFEPGSQFVYNNSGYFILGAIIEHVTGMSYEECLKKNILEPLGMNNTGYDHAEDIIKKRADGYRGNALGYKNAPFLDMSLPYAAGSMYSTVEDLYKWDRALYTDKLLPDEFKKIYFQPQVEALGGHYAYGWVIRDINYLSDDDLTMIAHGGGINGFNTLIARIIEDKKLVVLLNNTSGAPLNEMADAILKILYDKDYENPKQPVSAYLYKIIEEKGIDAAVSEYKQISEEEKDKYDLKESELNYLGYKLLNNNKVEEAIKIFKLNVEAYPDASNTYDSLGEAYMVKGDKENAMTNYKKSLELNPGNNNAVNKLKELGVEIDEDNEVEVDADILKSYEGEYQLQPNFIITITTKADSIYAQATGQAKFQIFPMSETKFFYKVVDAQIEFIKNDKGDVASLVLYQNGGKMPALKIE